MNRSIKIFSFCLLLLSVTSFAEKRSTEKTNLDYDNRSIKDIKEPDFFNIAVKNGFTVPPNRGELCYQDGKEITHPQMEKYNIANSCCLFMNKQEQSYEVSESMKLNVKNEVNGTWNTAAVLNTVWTRKEKGVSGEGSLSGNDKKSDFEASYRTVRVARGALSFKDSGPFTGIICWGLPFTDYETNVAHVPVELVKKHFKGILEYKTKNANRVIYGDGVERIKSQPSDPGISH